MEEKETKEDYILKKADNGTLQIESMEKERLSLTFKKLIDRYTIQTLRTEYRKKYLNNDSFNKEYKKELREILDNNNDNDFRELLAIDMKDNSIFKNHVKEIQSNYEKQIFSKFKLEYKPDFPNYEEFPNYFSPYRDNRQLQFLNGTLKKKIIDSKCNNENEQYANLFSKTMNEYGGVIFKDGKIAAQSIDVLTSTTEKTLFWSVCGSGVFGRDADAAYADLIAIATDSESMSMIRQRLKNESINMSDTNDEFSAVSAFIALNAKGKVYIASREGIAKGNYMLSIELPILLANPNVTQISWINTSEEFLEKLKTEGKNANDIKQFQNNLEITNLINNNSIILFDRDTEEKINDSNIKKRLDKMIEDISAFSPEASDKADDVSNIEESRPTTSEASGKVAGRNQIEEASKTENDDFIGFSDIFDIVNHEVESKYEVESKKVEEPKPIEKKLIEMTKEEFMEMSKETLSNKYYLKQFIEIMNKFEINPSEAKKEKEYIVMYIKKVYPNITRSLIDEIDGNKVKISRDNPDKLTPLALVRNYEKSLKKEKEVNAINNKFKKQMASKS